MEIDVKKITTADWLDLMSSLYEAVMESEQEQEEKEAV